MQTRVAWFFVVVAFVVVCALAPAAGPPAGCDSRRIGKLFEQLDEEDFYARLQADKDLRAMGKAVLPQLCAERDRTESLEVRHRLSVMIHDLTIDERIGQLVQLLDDKDDQMRARADYALRQVGPSVVPLLRKEIRPELSPQHRQRLDRIIAELSPKQKRGSEEQK